MLLNFKCYIVVVIILLFRQQSFAAYAPIKCDNMQNETIVSSDKDSHSTSQMTMHDHGSVSKDKNSSHKNSSHKNCDACNAADCLCGDMGSCFGSTTSTQTTEQKYMLFTDLGNRFLSQDEYPDLGFYINLFRPPIHI
jgi:hypothetical protein